MAARLPNDALPHCTKGAARSAKDAGVAMELRVRATAEFASRWPDQSQRRTIGT
jgi:hypothetical protein